MTSLCLCLAAMLLGTNYNSVGTQTPAPAVVSVVSSRSTAAEQQMLYMLNLERSLRKLDTLKINPTLSQAARAHSREMAAMDYFDHYSPIQSDRSPMKRYLNALGYTPLYASLSENIYYCSIFNVRKGHVALMNSPAHRANILSPKYDQVGIGCYVADDGRLWITQMFLHQVDQSLYSQSDTAQGKS